MNLRKVILFSVLVSANMIVWYENLGMGFLWVAVGVAIMYGALKRG